MTIEDLLREGTTELGAAGLTEAGAEAALLLGDLLGLDRLGLRARGEHPVPGQIAVAFRERMARRAQHEPAAYILGYRDFYKHRFRVTSAVLIPRPETEFLVERALEADLPTGARVLDLCCGSGCVGTSLQRERPNWHLTCSDISAPALALARENALAICGPDAAEAGRPTFVESDLFENISHRDFHAILCNPPYIHPDEARGLDPGLSYEPSGALYHPDPEAFSLRILSEAAERLVPGGLLVLESGPRWTRILATRARSSYKNVRIETDLAGLERTLVAFSR